MLTFISDDEARLVSHTIDHSNVVRPQSDEKRHERLDLTSRSEMRWIPRIPLPIRQMGFFLSTALAELTLRMGYVASTTVRTSSLR